MNEETRRLPANTPDWTIPVAPGKSGVRRRTVLRGAAWSLPVIMAATAIPTSSASVANLTLTFVNGPYSAVACGTVDDITVHAATNGTPAPAGTPVTVTLPAGLTWSDGTTAPRTLTTDANGDVVLSGLKAPNRNGDFALTAQSGAANTTSTLTTVGADSGVISQFGGGFLPSLPAGVRIEDVQTNTAPNGNVYTIVRGSDGNAYISNNTGSGWSTWTKATTPLAGSITDIAISNQGLTNVLASDTQISLYNGGVSTPLPNGATITDVQSYTTGGAGNPTAVAVVLGSDGRAYSNSFFNGAWSGWTATALAGATHIAVSETGGGAVVSSANRVAPVGGGAASPVLPNGATVANVTMNVNSNGVFGVAVLGSDGKAYSSAYNPTTGTWNAWSTSASSLNGSVTDIAMSHTGVNTVLATSSRVGLYAGGPVSAPLPNGATIVDVQATNNNGIPSVSVLGSDGRAYVSSYQNGAWKPWQASRVGQGKLEYISVSEARGWTLVASNPLC